MLIRASIKNPYAIVAISLIVVILGVVSFQKMEVDVFPEINLPVVAVATFYKGMGPSEMEGAITLRLEQLFLQTSYVEHIESRSLPGVSLIKIYFQPSYDVNAAVAEITSLTYSTLKYLPPGVFPPIIVKFGLASLPIGVLTASSEGLSEKDVRDKAYYNVRPQLATVPGIFVGPSFGGTVRQVTVFLDRERMLARGIAAQEGRQRAEPPVAGRQREDRRLRLQRLHEQSDPSCRSHERDPDQGATRRPDSSRRRRESGRFHDDSGQCRPREQQAGRVLADSQAGRCQYDRGDGRRQRRPPQTHRVTCRFHRQTPLRSIALCAYYFDSGDINSVRGMGLFCGEIPSKV